MERNDLNQANYPDNADKTMRADGSRQGTYANNQWSAGQPTSAQSAYSHNAWGKLLSVTDKNGNAITSASHIANLNPIRYRGYYYDTETGSYYLQSRYYDPANHRFINADGYTDTDTGFLGYNMFAYCNNNPVSLCDSGGNKPVEIIDTDGDGEIDCYVYQYTYPVLEITLLSRVCLNPFAKTVEATGYVCFFPGLSEEDFDNGVNLPEKYADSVLIGDQRKRNRDNPNMQAYESYRIRRTAEKAAIIDTMIEYDREYPTSESWNRTKKSLLFEWNIHNIGYRLLGYQRARSTDFDRNEEGWTVIKYYEKFRGA